MNLENLPKEFLERMQRMLGPEFEAFLSTYEEPRKFGLRVNTMKISVEEFKKTAPFHLTPIPWVPNGFYYEREDDPARHPFYYAGLYYLQEPSAMTPAGILPVSPGERVLDLCAAPGGKATALGAKLDGQGLLVANDISASRAKALLKNLEVFGIRNSFVTNAAPAKLAQQFDSAFDKILVDAPCSGEGMFRKDIANAKVWSLQKVAECAKIQHEITRQAVAMLRPGGLMLYSTCTFSAEENEQTIAALLQDCPELELLEIPWYEGFSHGMPELADGNEALRRCVRIFPHRMEGEGHFLALLRKRSMADGNDTQAGSAGAEYSDAASRSRDAEAGGMCSRDTEAGEMCSRDTEAGELHGRDTKVRDVYGEDTCGGEMHSGEIHSRKKRKDRIVDNRRKNGVACGQSSFARRQSASGRDGRTGQTAALREQTAGLAEFLQDIAGDYELSCMDIRKDQVYYTQNRLPSGGGIPFLRNGLYFGELRKGRFEPSQSLAMALRAKEYASVLDFEPTDERVRRYLCGETIEVDDLTPARPSGWQLVCVAGYPLGWGKLVKGTLKNKYHSGWRMPG